MNEDDMARMRAEMDQAKEGLREVAGTLWAFYRALTNEGFKAHQALILTSAFMQSQMARNAEPEDEE